MFGKNTETIKEVKVLVKDEEAIRVLENKIKDITADFESQTRIANNEVAMKISQATATKDAENGKLKEENAVLRKEVEILTKAFENMGFDVKDMKEILNKLVDGIVSKNEVNVIK